MSTTINSELEIDKRLLKAFSVESLKAVFNLTESKERQAGLLNIISRSYTTDDLYSIVFEHFSLLKQYVYLYEFKGALDDEWLDKHPSFISKQKISNSHSIFNLLIPVTYEGYNKTQRDVQEFNFLVPVQIHKKKNILSIHINLLERDIATITSDTILSPRRDINDEKILASITPYANPTHLYKYDLNKGIKKLWHENEIEAMKVKFKKAKSTSQEVMDESDFGIKKEMPKEYAELIKTPIRQTTFRLLEKENLVNFFVVDPTTGIFNFSVYPPYLNGINDLIDLVVKNNN
ncbi:hypothetical protein B0A79_19990 [Flavobacterium piscis]|uniref:DUF4747 family protein n=1 Tax=Flavobacterium piscis TaxID=1114874 RepID=A0ABX2XN02_9FLAO|nr:hypothetical protein [Flavobacterium piscis]OCB73640.1 hypothetical protein FLP_13240 [Flavobacterium piscis]OXE98462.1 hypothetical protein B0A79_19990 [Flavobacterium piscis]